MDGFDAVAHSFSTVSVGGFSTHDANMGYFDNPVILVVCILFMVLGAINFALHYLCWRQRSLRAYGGDPEARFFLAVIAVLSVSTVSILYTSGSHGAADGLLQGVFHVVSVITTTGFTTGHFLGWPVFVPLLLLLFACMGGCGGSTAGGIKAIRVLLICKQGMRELRQLVHPQAVFPVRLGRRTIPDRVIIAVWSFFAVYVLTFIAILFALLLAELDFVTAFSAVAATLNNLGPGLGEVSLHYFSMSGPVKWLLCLSMLLGRLEIFTLLVLFTPAFWRD
jgi:trk system potassium uptake protein TrkH